MTAEVKYGKIDKSISFLSSDARHAELVLKLRRDGITKSFFFNRIVESYIKNDPVLMPFVSSVKETVRRVSNSKVKKVEKQIFEGEQVLQEYGFTEGDIDFIFDLIDRGADDV